MQTIDGMYDQLLKQLRTSTALGVTGVYDHKVGK